MSEHDPLCLLYPRSEGRSRGFCVCEVIQQARNEALSGETALASESYDLGYEQGQRDALAHHVCATLEQFECTEYEQGQADMLARCEGTDLAAVIEQAIDAMPMERRLYPDIYAGDVAAAVLAALRGLGGSDE